ncbi:tryptophan--tRNA ligase [Halalkalibacter alkalisediminis]|uniref:Tryptophan--tRNA ligase n=1 Tax=Halalkalibacter alkalisediminis TaxID=935616 RepID=A0ABV6NNU4_9BACI|nr:tryptophan--tRNA ligase [Halalkalibacter alkalisediminis]
MKKNVLTGIKPTGDIHLGNYIGAIKPAIALSKNEHYQSAYFVADYHALTNVPGREEYKDHSCKVAATWLALGLDPTKTIFYRQSDVPEIFELTWILSCLASKGLMNRAHAYKALADSNLDRGRDRDFGVNMGLFTYPVLMAADILLLKTDIVPVGKDQIQHIEIARDLADTFNKTYGDTFSLPQYQVEENTAVLLGLDGRKMSKSYKNTIPLFEESKKRQKLINKIKTDSSPPGACKDPYTSIIFSLYQEFASANEVLIMRERYENGISWGEAKQELGKVMNDVLEEPRETYLELINAPKKLNEILLEGAEKARAISVPFLKEIREKIGLLS